MSIVFLTETSSAVFSQATMHLEMGGGVVKGLVAKFYR